SPAERPQTARRRPESRRLCDPFGEIDSGIALVAREGLVAAVAGERDGDVAARDLRDEQRRERRLVAEGLVERLREPRQQLARIGLDHDLLVPGAVPRRDLTRVAPLVVDGV